jgi:predicted Fe-S protein YdhL (DUF1289 family)
MDKPCVKICDYDDDSGWCRGCGMTKPERKAWKRVPGYRAAIVAALPARLDAMAREGHAVGAAAGRRT